MPNTDYVPVDVIQPKTATGPRSYRILIGGELLLVEATGKPRQFSESAAYKYREKLYKERHTREDVEEAPKHQETTTSAPKAPSAPVRVLDTSRRRLDGLTHEEAAERLFEEPPPIACLHSAPRRMLLVGYGMSALYIFQRTGDVESVEIRELSSTKLYYSGTLADLLEGGSKTKHAVKLAPWRTVTPTSIRAYREGATG